MHQIGGAYTNALDIRLASGRLLTDSELNTAQPVAVVNEPLRGDPLQRTSAARPDRQAAALASSRRSRSANEAFQIVGVVHDVLNEGLVERADSGDLRAVSPRRVSRISS